MLKGIKRALSLLLVVCIISCVSMAALAEEPDVAKIGAVTYKTLDDAITAASSGDTIELLSNAEITVNQITKKLNIAGNGKTVNVPKQKSTGTGALEFTSTSELNFDNTIVKFGNPTNWSVTLATGSVLSFSNKSVCSFEFSGIYSSPNGTIKLDNSDMILENMKYTSIMGESYGNLNITNKSNFTIKNPMNINGITGFNITVDDSIFNVLDCQRQGIVKSSLTLTNGAVANVLNCYTGYNLWAGNELLVNAGTTINFEGCDSRAIMSQSSGAVTIKNGGNLNVTKNGQAFRSQDDDAKYYAQKGAITVGVYGYYKNEDGERIITSSKASLNFEDGANVNISNNYVRGIVNFGTSYIGNTTKIMNNGAVDADETIRFLNGGGIYNAGTLTAANGAQIYNNHAAVAADDVYNAANAKLTLCAVGTNWTLDDCNHTIDNWYDDAETARWNFHDDSIAKHTVTFSKVTTELSEELSLKAAHNNIQPPIIVVEDETPLGGLTPSDKTPATGTPATGTPIVVDDKTPLGNIADTNDSSPVAATVALLAGSIGACLVISKKRNAD